MGQHSDYGKKYVVTGETKEVNGKLLWQIRATRNLAGPYHAHTRAGDLGGWLQFPGHDHESQETRGFTLGLSQENESWVGHHATVTDHARVFGNARVHGNVTVKESAQVYERASVSGHTVLSGNSHVSGDAYLHGNVHVTCAAHVTDRVSVEAKATVSGATVLGGRCQISYGAEIGGGVFHAGNIRRRARVEESGHVIVVDGLLQDVVTIYRAETEGNHYATAGCQTFKLDWDLEELAAEHEWELPRYWRSFRQVMLKAVREWEPVKPQGQAEALRELAAETDHDD